MEYHYFSCNRCTQTFRTFINNPDNHIACARCGNMFFHEISKEEYFKARSGK